MFKKNHRHLQIPLTSHVDELPEKLRKRLENSWAGVFYREFFSRLKETPFEVLYADCPSRPNVPVNVMIGLEYLKAGNGWTDEEMYDSFRYRAISGKANAVRERRSRCPLAAVVGRLMLVRVLCL
jgi:hypothetical protein